MKNLILFALLGMTLPCLGQKQRDLTIYGVGNYTAPSLGVSTSHLTIWQTDTFGVGGGAQFEAWKYGNGLVVGADFTQSHSRLLDLNQNLLTTWKLQRYKADLLYEHRFHFAATQPYLGIGGFMTVLWGGNAPAHSNVNASGFDVLGGIAVPAGIYERLSPRLSLKVGAVVDFGKASTYGDTAYTASQNLSIEPRAGIEIRLGKVQ